MRQGSAKCPRCGRKKSHTKAMLIGLIAIQAIAIGSYMHFSVPKMPRIVIEDSQPQPVQLTALPTAGWYYYETKDELVHDITKHARVVSVSAGTAGPGPGGTTGVLELRASPTYGSSVVITLTRDPLDVVSDQCEVRAKFDAGDVQVFHASGSVDATRATLVVDDTQGFTGRLANAHTLSLVAQLSEKSVRTTNFNIDGLNWN